MPSHSAKEIIEACTAGREVRALLHGGVRLQLIGVIEADEEGDVEGDVDLAIFGTIFTNQTVCVSIQNDHAMMYNAELALKNEIPTNEYIDSLIEEKIGDLNLGSGGVDFEVDSTLKLENGILSVNATNTMEQDNTLPITSAGVFATVGNIEALLKTI